MSAASRQFFRDAAAKSADGELRQIVRRGVEAFSNRNPKRVRIPVDPVPMMAGFSVEAILGALGGTPKPLIDAIAKGTIRGAGGGVVVFVLFGAFFAMGLSGFGGGRWRQGGFP